jgi:hypothetical protein
VGGQPTWTNQTIYPIRNRERFHWVIRLIQGSESCTCFQDPRNLPVDSLDLTDEPHRRFLVQGHVLSVGGDALMALYAKGSGFLNRSLF